MIEIDEMIEFLKEKKLEKAKTDPRHLLREFCLYQYNKKHIHKLNHIANCVSESTGIKLESMCGKTRMQPVVEARQIAMHFMKKNVPVPPHIIGKFFSTKRHSFDRNTVDWAAKQVQNYFDTDKWFRLKYEDIESKINTNNF